MPDSMIILADSNVAREVYAIGLLAFLAAIAKGNNIANGGC